MAKKKSADRSLSLTRSAWAYLVVSSEDQSDTLDRQLSWAKEEADRKDWRLDRIFDGVASGRDGVRVIFDRMLTELKATPADRRPAFILMTRLDRIGRGNMVESQVALHELHALGSKVWSREGGEVKLDNAMDSLIAAVKLAVGSQENEVRRDKAKSVYVARRKARESDERRAITSKGPYGTRFEDGYLVPKAPECEAIRVMFDLRLAGHGSHVIGKKLAAIAPPMEQKNGVTRALRWNADLVSKLLRRQSYVDAGIITESEFLRVQLLRDPLGGSRPKKHPWPLTGAVRCECGTPLHGLTNSSGRFWYVCEDRYRVHGKMVCHPRADIESKFWALLHLLGSAPIFADQPEAEATTRKMLVTKLSALRAEGTKIGPKRERVWSAFDAGSLRQDALQSRLDTLDAQERSLRDEADELEAQLATMNAQQMSADEKRALVKSAVKRWKAADESERKALSRTIASAFGGLVVMRDGTFKVGGVNGIAVNS